MFCRCVLMDLTFLENLVSVNAVNRLRDEIRRQKQLQAYYHQQYNEFLSKKAAYDDNQTEIREQTGTFLLNPTLMQNLLRMATKVIFSPYYIIAASNSVFILGRTRDWYIQ
jgi:hypothetical protein